MATLWITELRSLGRGSDGGTVPVAPMPAANVQTVTFSTAAASSAFSGTTRYVRLYSDADCEVRFGADPTAAAGDTPLAADTPEYFGVEPNHKVSVVAR